jgi:predicted nucleic acid-binding protein
MSYLLDTNVLCETSRTRPEPKVIQWLQGVASEDIYLSVIALGEIRKGIEALGDAHRKNPLRLWLEHDLPRWFGERILPIDIRVADRWGYLMATATPVPAIDGLLAATALTHSLKIVTRNEKDFRVPGIEVINPWKA